MFSYKKLINRIKRKGLNRSVLTKELGISSRTIAKLPRGEKLSPATLRKIASYLSCDPEDLYEIVSDNPILQRLREEKETKISGSLYHEVQVRMTYNSNHIEGSTLTEDQTRMIFETKTINADGGVSVNDIMETVNHFRAIDYVIDHAEEVLSEEHIKALHYILKHNTKDEELSWFKAGSYKQRPNYVGGHETAKPAEVPEKIGSLLRTYNEIPEVTIEDIVCFHAEFEMIHPFQDGNGRVGRLIAFKECLRWNVVPFLIEDSKKTFYYRGLSQWKQEKGYLIDTCLDGQDTFRRILKYLEINGYE